MMANAGPQGRFNRAQRAVFNYDEALPLFLSGLLLNALLGPGRFWLRGPTESLCTPRDRAGGKGSFRGETRSRSCPGVNDPNPPMEAD